jgi:hypothetical protein
MENDAGTIAIEERDAPPPDPPGAVTVIEIVSVTVPIEAVIVAVLGLTAVNRPEALTVAIVLLELCQVTCEVTSWVVPSL